MSDPTALVYLNGRVLPLERACISVLDRGFLFGDGVYEVIPAYGGRLFRLQQHLRRLDQSLAGIRMSNPHTDAEWEAILNGLLSHMGSGDSSVYLQVTRGIAPNREHNFPEHEQPTVFAMASPMAAPPAKLTECGVAAITLDDTRWFHCHIKAITLLPNVLLRQQAADAGAFEAILLRSGYAIEGAASNLFVVTDDLLITPPKGPHLLPGITRDLIIELAARNGIPYRETSIPKDLLAKSQEVWLTSSTREIVPVTRLNERPVGDGQPGPLWRRMIALYQKYKQGLRGAA